MSLLSGTAQAAHSAVTSLLSVAQIQPGHTIPSQTVKEDSADRSFPLTLKGRNIIIGVPGAFTGTCSAQIPAYIDSYAQFKAKGVNEIFVVAVNDVFVVKAWKEQLAPQGTSVRFFADDKGVFSSALGLIFDASLLLGSPRSKRYVIISDGDVVESIAVEQDPGALTVTAAETILAQLS